MKVKELPLIYNIDKVRVYKDNKKIADFKVESGWHLTIQIERNLPRGGGDYKITSMSIVVEGVLAEVVVLELHLSEKGWQ